MLSEVKYNDLLELAGVDHYLDIAPKGLASHTSSNGKSTYKDRIEKHASWGGGIFEAILYGHKQPRARDVVLAWVIDDGFKSRTHRKNLFNPIHKHVSIIAGPHSSAEFCVIAMFAAQIMSKAKGAEIELKNQEKRAKEYRK